MTIFKNNLKFTKKNDFISLINHEWSGNAHQQAVSATFLIFNFAQKRTKDKRQLLIIR